MKFNKVLFYVAMIFTAILFIHVLDKLLFSTLPSITDGQWSYIIKRIHNLDNTTPLFSSLIKMFGIFGLFGVIVNFATIVRNKSNTDPYHTMLPLISCGFIALSAIYLSWGYALAGIIGLSVHRVMAGLGK